MNGVPEYYEVKMKQTSKGIWYCDGFTASTKVMETSVAEANLAMTMIEAILNTHNKEAEETTADKWKKPSKMYNRGLKGAEK